jgi:hypothetical protein
VRGTGGGDIEGQEEVILFQARHHGP